MAVSKGRLGTVEVSTDGGSTYNPIGKLINPKYTMNTAAIKTTTHDSGAFDESLPGRISGSLDLPCLLDEADAQQVALLNGITGQTVFKFRFRTKGAGVGNFQYIADGWVSDGEQDAPLDDAADMSFKITLTGTIAKSTQ
jgi:hypothetical protein